MGYADFENGTLIDYGLRFFKSARKIEYLLDDIERTINRLLLDKQPDILILEQNRFSQLTSNVRLTLAILRIKSLAKKHKLKVIEYAPKTIRAIVTKSGTSTKSDTAKVIVSKYPEIGHIIRNQSPSSLSRFYNVTDAIACGQAFIELHSLGNKEQRR
jgi:Holliday junction resolvasome RuvABC endonuclease subunit